MLANILCLHDQSAVPEQLLDFIVFPIEPGESDQERHGAGEHDPTNEAPGERGHSIFQFLPSVRRYPTPRIARIDTPVLAPGRCLRNLETAASRAFGKTG